MFNDVSKLQHGNWEFTVWIDEAGVPRASADLAPHLRRRGWHKTEIQLRRESGGWRIIHAIQPEYSRPLTNAGLIAALDAALVGEVAR